MVVIMKYKGPGLYDPIAVADNRTRAIEILYSYKGYRHSDMLQWWKYEGSDSYRIREVEKWV